MNISKTKLEELFVDELARLQPTPGFMRLVKDRVLHAWREMKTHAKQRIAEIERKQKAIQQKLDRLDEAFLFERTIDIETYDRHRDKLREELALAQMDERLCDRDVTAQLRSRKLEAGGEANGLARLVPVPGCGEHPWQGQRGVGVQGHQDPGRRRLREP